MLLKDNFFSAMEHLEYQIQFDPVFSLRITDIYFFPFTFFTLLFIIFEKKFHLTTDNYRKYLCSSVITPM